MTVHLKKSDFFKPVDSPIAMARRNPQWRFALHSHEFCEIVFIISGHGTHLLDDQEYEIGTGDVFVITEGMLHGYGDIDNLNLINVYFDKTALAMPVQDLYYLSGYRALFTLEPAYRTQQKFMGRLNLSAVELDEALSLIEIIDRELRSKRSGYRFMACAVFMQLACFVSRCYEKQSAPRSKDLLTLGRAIDYLHLHYTEHIDLDMLAGIARMSKRNFTREFRYCMVDSPINYLMKLRIARAADLLARSAQSITDIAFEVGFLDSNYFTRQFRNIMGITPKEYREKNRMVPADGTSGNG